MVFGSWGGKTEETAPVVKEEVIIVKKEEPPKKTGSAFGLPFGAGAASAPTAPPLESPIILEVAPAATPAPEPIEKVKNPGRFEDISRESKEVIGTQECFDGLKCELIKGFSPSFQITHLIGLGSSAEPANYNFAAMFLAGYDPQTGKPPKSILNGRIDTDGHLMGRLFHWITPSLQIKLTGQTGNEPHSSGVGVDLEYEGRDWHGQLKWVAPGTYGIAYHQAVTRHLSLGVDLMYRHQNAFCMSSYGARYDTKKWVGSAVFNPHQAAIAYTQKVSEQVNLATELSVQQGQSGKLESVWSFGMDYRLRQSMFRGHIDSTGKVFGYLEEALTQNAKFLLSAELDHKKGQYKFGLGMTVAI